MAYKAYITEALVCGSENHNTSDRSYLLFSREAGMLWATARSVREERSKQRYSLQDFSYVRVTLIRGKSGWKIAGAEPLTNLYLRAGKREERAMVMRTVQLLRRFMRGETPHQQIFDDVLTMFLNRTQLDLEISENIIFLRVLHELGYIAPSPSYDALLTIPRVEATQHLFTAEQRNTVRTAIDRALLESQL